MLCALASFHAAAVRCLRREFTQHLSPSSMLWWGREVRVVTKRSKMHGRKSVLGFGMARGELTRGQLMRFDCSRSINITCEHRNRKLVSHQNLCERADEGKNKDQIQEIQEYYGNFHNVFTMWFLPTHNSEDSDTGQLTIKANAHRIQRSENRQRWHKLVCQCSLSVTQHDQSATSNTTTHWPAIVEHECSGHLKYITDKLPHRLQCQS